MLSPEGRPSADRFERRAIVSTSMKVTRTVDASPESLFALLSTPSRHTEFDGSNMMRGTEGPGTQVNGVGDQFVMKMNNPNLGDYRMRNTIVAYEPGRTIGWAPEIYPVDGYTDKIGDMQARGHTYTWHLEPAGPGRTTVTQVYDWSEVPDEQFRGMFPMLTEQQLSDSIERAARAAS